MPRKKEGECNEFCQEHWGLKAMLTTIIIGIVGILGLQVYGNFFQMRDIQVAMAQTKEQVASLQKAYDSLNQRVAKIENKKP